jgi:hypothetical protein
VSSIVCLDIPHIVHTASGDANCHTESPPVLSDGMLARRRTSPNGMITVYHHLCEEATNRFQKTPAVVGCQESDYLLLHRRRAKRN